MFQPLRRWAVLAAVAGLLVAVGGLSWAQDPDSPDRDTPGKRKTEVASGVIVRVDTARSEGSGKEGRPPRRVEVTINTAAVWRDYVRDQAAPPEKAATSPAAAAAKGSESVATKGEPKTESTLVSVEVGRGTRITVRYRSSTDETSLGAPAPEGAAKAEAGKDEPEGKPGRRERREAETAEVDDLKPGLFVRVEYRHREDRNRALSVSILRPVGGPDTPAKEASPR